MTTQEDKPVPISVHSLLAPAFITKLSNPSVRKVVMVGCGGGFDFVHSMLVYPELKRLGKDIIIVSNSFGNVEEFAAEPLTHEYNARPRLDVRLIQAETGHLNKSFYAPELHVLSHLDQYYHQDVPHSMYACNAREMVVPAFSRFLQSLNADVIIAVDGGSDALMKGDEEGLGDPIEDAVTVASVHLCSAPVKILLTVGLGCDRFNHVSDASSLRAISELTKMGGFLGSLSIQGPSLDFYTSCLEHIYRQQSFRSVLSGSIVAAGHGYFGSSQESARAIGSPRVRPGYCYLWPLMSMIWAFDISTVARRSWIVAWVQDATTLQQQQCAYFQARKSVTIRNVEELPRHVDYRS